MLLPLAFSKWLNWKLLRVKLLLILSSLVCSIAYSLKFNAAPTLHTLYSQFESLITGYLVDLDVHTIISSLVNSSVAEKGLIIIL